VAPPVNLRAYWRFFVVVRHFLPLMLAYARDRNRFLFFGSSRRVTAEQRRDRAATLLDSLLTLGPTFIKLGRPLSTRPDVLPPEYIDEFTKLQDRVPPAPWADAKTVLEAELGPVDERFDEFDVDAISGASLGQVYRAGDRRRTGGGEDPSAGDRSTRRGRPPGRQVDAPGTPLLRRRVPFVLP